MPRTLLLTMAFSMFAESHHNASALASSMWKVLETQSPVQAWKTLFGDQGQRGEYMDGYSETAMVQRCEEDYKWKKDDDLLLTRADMMSHLYDNERLWKHVSMVAFAEHYISRENDNALENNTPFKTFQRHKRLQQLRQPIFGGVVLNDWQSYNKEDSNDVVQRKLENCRNEGVDYIRLECNFGSTQDIGPAAQLADDSRFRQLAQLASECQTNHQMVPVMLIQVPWRQEPGLSMNYFQHAVKSLASALKEEGVDPKQLILETRPPIGLSASEERSLSRTERIALGLKTGQRMFEVIEQAFENTTLAGFCVAGGSTKGDLPTAMEDDCQNAVRQGMRRCAQQRWGYELCFWEMGAKLMLQPKVGRLWQANGQAGRDAARELFCVNANDMADEIKMNV